MRPGVTIDRDHIDRFTRYADELTARITASTGGRFRRVMGTIIADRLEKSKPGIQTAIKRLESSGLCAASWETLLSDAEHEFRDYFNLIVGRSAGDPRVALLSPRYRRRRN